MNDLRILKMMPILLVVLLLSEPSISDTLSYVKESPVALYNIQTGFLPFVEDGIGNNQWMYASLMFELRAKPSKAIFYPLSNGKGSYTFQNTRYNYCIERYSNGIVQKTCNPAEPYQQWALKYMSNGSFLIKLAFSEHNSNTNLCMYTSGNDIYVGACNENSASHRWAFIPPPSALFELVDSAKRKRRTPVNRMITASWNMQGANGQGGDTNKWVDSVYNIMIRGGFSDTNRNNHRIDVLAVQEAGEPPQHQASTVIPNVIRPVVPGYIAAPNVVQRNTVAVRNHFVYHVEVAQRVHTAIVSRVAADEVFLFPVLRTNAQQQPPASARPTLGIRIADAYFFTVHAGSMNDGDTGNRNEAALIVQAIERYMATNVVPNNPAATWMIMGDFNRTPNNMQRSLQPPPAGLLRDIVFVRDATCQNACAATQDSGLSLDFAVVGGGPNADRFYQAPFGSFLLATALNHNSDHIGIRYRPSGM